MASSGFFYLTKSNCSDSHLLVWFSSSDSSGSWGGSSKFIWPTLKMAILQFTVDRTNMWAEVSTVIAVANCSLYSLRHHGLEVCNDDHILPGKLSLALKLNSLWQRPFQGCPKFEIDSFSHNATPRYEDHPSDLSATKQCHFMTNTLGSKLIQKGTGYQDIYLATPSGYTIHNGLHLSTPPQHSKISVSTELGMLTNLAMTIQSCLFLVLEVNINQAQISHANQRETNGKMPKETESTHWPLNMKASCV